MQFSAAMCTIISGLANSIRTAESVPYIVAGAGGFDELHQLADPWIQPTIPAASYLKVFNWKTIAMTATDF